MELIASFSILRSAPEPGIDSKPQQQRLHSQHKFFAARSIVNSRSVKSGLHPNATICRPQMAQEYTNRFRRLLEYFRRNALLIRSQSPNAQIAQPVSNSAVNIMCV